MSKFTHHEQCPKCVARGNDRRGNNLGCWADGSRYCFSCGYYVPASYRASRLTEVKDDNEKAVLPSDFTREIPAAAWKWLLQYKLPYSYWQPHCGYSPKEERLVFLIGTPVRFSIGRYVGESVGKSKWKVYGDKFAHVEVIGKELSGEIVLVEDIISAHKVGQVTRSIPLFGTTIGDSIIKKLQELKAPVSLWLDADQYTHLPKKIGRLQTLLGASVRHISTKLDPKGYSPEEIKRILNA